MYTSYFACQHLKYHNNLVAISLTVPKQMHDKIGIYRLLSPPWRLLSAYKEGNISISQYEKIYTETVLQKLDPISVYKALGHDAVHVKCYIVDIQDFAVGTMDEHRIVYVVDNRCQAFS